MSIAVDQLRQGRNEVKSVKKADTKNKTFLEWEWLGEGGERVVTNLVCGMRKNINEMNRPGAWEGNADGDSPERPRELNGGSPPEKLRTLNSRELMATDWQERREETVEKKKKG